LDESRLYSVATNNYVVGNFEAHFGVSGQGLTVQTLPQLDREVFVERIRSERIISSTLDGRITDVARKRP
jgi:hypothetical protein